MLNQTQTLDSTEMERITELDARLELITWSAGADVSCTDGTCTESVHVGGTF